MKRPRGWEIPNFVAEGCTLIQPGALWPRQFWCRRNNNGRVTGMNRIVLGHLSGTGILHADFDMPSGYRVLEALLAGV